MSAPTSPQANRPTPLKGARGLAWLAVGLILAQMILGATVRATGSGMGCPDWPLCHGQYLPAMNYESILEYSHRAVAAFLSLVLVSLAGAIALKPNWRQRLGRLAAMTAALLTALITFGAITVAYDMPPVVVACHLVLAVGLLFTWILAALRAMGVAGPDAPLGAWRGLALAAVGFGVVQIFLGALVSVSHAGLACPDFPTCYGMLLPPLVGNVGIQMVHRFAAYTLAALVAALVVAAELKADRGTRRLTRLAGGLVVVQIALGAATVLGGIPIPLSVAHLANGVFLVGTLFSVACRAHPAFFLKPGSGGPSGPSGGEAVAEGAGGAGPWAQLKPRFAAYMELTKPSIVLLVVMTGLPAVLIASGGEVDPWLMVVALTGTALAAASAATFNQYFERERDKVMARTAQRPIPSGRVAPEQALAFALALGTASMGLLVAFTTWQAAAWALASLLFYGFFYTLVLKDAGPQNIVIGGAAGSSAPVIGWAAVEGSVALPAWVMAAIIFFWTPPHFWALAIFKLDEYRAAKMPMHPVVHGVASTSRWIVAYSMVLVPLSLVLVPLGAAGPLYFGSAMLLGLGFLGLAYQVLVKPERKAATRLFAYSIVYTLVLFSALTLDAALGGPGLLAPNGAPLAQPPAPLSVVEARR